MAERGRRLEEGLSNAEVTPVENDRPISIDPTPLSQSSPVTPEVASSLEVELPAESETRASELNQPSESTLITSVDAIDTDEGISRLEDTLEKGFEERSGRE